jgi:hypothetical protein
VSGNLISGNTCASNHWAMGAGIHCETGCFGPSVVITDNVVTDNAITGTGTTTAMGGGIFANGYVSIRHNTIANNATPGLGGGVYATNSSSYCPAVVTVANNTIGSNVAGTGGGGIYCGSYGTGKVVVSNNVLQSNACTSGTGGGILSSNYAQAPTITNNTITGSQQATNGGGISCNQGTVTNNIIAHNCSGTYYSGSTPPAIAFTYNDSYDNTSYNYQNFTAGTGCITSNPTLAEDGIHLMSSSSCVDVGYDAATGLQSTEIDGGDRLVDIPSIGSTEVDIGADEYEPANTEFSVGLPTTNLNNAAGASRSNVRWGNADYTIGYGDSFTPSSNCTVYGLRVWAVPDIPVVPAYLLGDHYGDISLYVNTTPTGMTKLSGGNLLAGSNSTTNPSIRIAPVSYPQNPGVNYQAANGRFQQIWQIDFTGLNWALTADQTYVLGVTATPRVDRYWFLHATCPSSGTADFYTFDTGDLTQEPSAVTGYAWLLKYSNINFELFTR